MIEVKLSDDEYIEQLERMAQHLGPDENQWFYYDILPQSSLFMKAAYARATGDISVLDDEC